MGMVKAMAAAKKAAGEKVANGGKRNFFATMSGEVIKAIKQAALDDDVSASELLEEAARDWLDRRAAGRTGKKRRYE
jgi:hypothetical protein